MQRDHHLQTAALEAALWDELFSTANTVCSRGAPPSVPHMTATAVGRVLRRVDRTMGLMGAMTSDGAYVGPGGPTAATVKDRYREMLKDREQLSRLLVEPGVTQRTPEWYSARNGLVTASDFAQAMGKGKFASQKEFFLKKVPVAAVGAGGAGGDASSSPSASASTPSPMASSPALKWGVMFESVALDVYRSRNGGIPVHEFGLLRHPSIPHIGASPDGITDAGVMVEVKCPYQRRINREVPYQYYCQIQGQLDVCRLRHCDYLECEFDRYTNEHEFLSDSLEEEEGNKDDGGGGGGSGMYGKHRHHVELSRDGREKGAIAEVIVHDPPSSPHSSSSSSSSDAMNATTPASTSTPTPTYLYSPFSPYGAQNTSSTSRNEDNGYGDRKNGNEEKHETEGISAYECWMSDLRRRAERGEITLMNVCYWKLKTYSVLRVEADPEMMAEMLHELGGIWRRVLTYRSDPEAFRREVQEAPSRSRSVTSASASASASASSGCYAVGL